MSDDWDDEDDDEKFIELQRNPHNLDESLIRWTAMLIAQGYKKHEVRKKLADADLDRRSRKRHSTPYARLIGKRMSYNRLP